MVASTYPCSVSSTSSRPSSRSSRSEEHTSELQSRQYLVCRLLLEKKNKHRTPQSTKRETTWYPITPCNANPSPQPSHQRLATLTYHNITLHVHKQGTPIPLSALSH